MGGMATPLAALAADCPAGCQLLKGSADADGSFMVTNACTGEARP
jgi:hypothetical protein